MKISLNWIKKYVNIPESVSNEELIRLIGARLVEVEGVIDETHKYDHIYVARVEKAEKISETHLTLCQINVGADDLVQVVCGAPNVREGTLAVWIAPGAVVPASVHEDAPFVIGKRKMRGYESSGMLAGADELDFDDKHEKIAEIDPAMARPGDKLANVFELDDLILEIENKSLTHRPDCFGIIGFAREVAGILGLKFNEPEFLTHEEVFPEGFLAATKDGIESSDNTLAIEISDPKLCPRYTGAIIKVNDALAEEKYLSMMQVLLAKSGMMTNSRIVDVTNYLMLLTGQPLHAFDYDKFLTAGKSDQPKITVRPAKNGEKLELLDGKVVECQESDILITSNDAPVAMAGAMGGKNTEIDENTKNVLLESASFSLFNLRKTQMAHGIFSEAITRFTKGVPVGGTFNVLAEAVKEINGKPLALCDKIAAELKPSVVKIEDWEINALLGTNYEKELIIKTLENVSFDIQKESNNLVIVAPYWRTDIHIKEDIIEEIGRLLGYDNIAPTLPLHATAGNNQLWELKKRIRNILARFGANEVLTYSFVSGRLLDKVGQDKNQSYRIVNSISPELQYVRQSIVPSLLEKTYLNEKLPVEQFALFEMNKVYSKAWGGEPVPTEMNSLGFVVAERKNNETAFYKAKLYVSELMKALGVEIDFAIRKTNEEAWRPFEEKRSADILLNDEVVGVVGEFKNSVKHEFKLAPYVAGFELVNLEKILENVKAGSRIDFKKKKKEDVTITTDKTYAEVLAELKDKYPEAIITPGTIYQAPEQKTKNITFHIER